MKIIIKADEGIDIKVKELNGLQTELAALFYKDLEQEAFSLDATINEEGIGFFLHQEHFENLPHMANWLQAVYTSIDNFQRLCEDVAEKINHFRGD